MRILNFSCTKKETTVKTCYLLILTGMSGSSFSHQGSSYEVTTRARVIIFDMAALQSNNILNQSSSSADHLQRSPSRDHSGLMSWPQLLSAPRPPQKQKSEKTERPAESLSAKAMQLSIYGSMVCSVVIFQISLYK